MANKSKKTKWAEVSCAKHGKPDADNKVNNWKEKQVRVIVPNSKRERLAGCPLCRKERMLSTA